MFIHIFVVVGVCFLFDYFVLFSIITSKATALLPLTGSDSAITRVTTYLQNILM